MNQKIGLKLLGKTFYNNNILKLQKSKRFMN